MRFHLHEIFNTKDQYKTKFFLSQASVDGEVVSEGQVVDGGLRQGGLGFVLIFRVECRITPRSHRKDLSGQHDSRWNSPQDVIQEPRTDVRDQGPRALVSRKQDSPGRGLHSQQSKFGRCAFVSKRSRHVVLASVHVTTALALGRVDFGLTGLHRPICLQTEHS